MHWPQRFLGVPLHPMLVHFPLAFWLSVPVFGLAAHHGVRTTVVWCVMAIKQVVVGLASAGTTGVWISLVVELLACALLFQGAFFGTRITYGGYQR